MKVSPFPFDAGPPSGARPVQAPAVAETPPVMRASPEREPDDPRQDEALEEPGYGHGV